MNLKWRRLLLLLFLCLLTIVFGGFQTSAWYLLFGNFPPPQLWLVLLVYVAITKPLGPALILTYALSLCNSAFTALPFGVLLLLSLLTVIALIYIRTQFYWGGPAYFVVIVGATSFIWPVAMWIASRVYDANPITIPAIWDWLISTLMTALVSPPLYATLEWVERRWGEDRSGEIQLGSR